jgi:hypothetical protein
MSDDFVEKVAVAAAAAAAADRMRRGRLERGMTPSTLTFLELGHSNYDGV